MTKEFDLQGYYAHETKIGPQGGGWAEPTANTQKMVLQQIAHEIYAKWQGENNLKNWKQDERYVRNTRANQNAIHNIINNWIRQDYF